MMSGIYTRGSARYSVIETDFPRRHLSGVAVFYRPSPQYAVEATQHFGPNVVGFQIATGERRWCIIGCYLAPNNTSTIESAVTALKERSRGSELIVSVDLNINMEDPDVDWREEEIAAALTATGI